jgi:lysophospholipase L1-like esterase
MKQIRLLAFSLITHPESLERGETCQHDEPMKTPRLPWMPKLKFLAGLSLCHALVATALIGVEFPIHAADISDAYEQTPTNTYFAKFNPRRAPEPGPLLLREGDRLAIVGDSITEQKRYSRIIETYLTVCVPELKITARQFGWSGEKADGFLARMTNDCLRFNPTVATLCYGMNDHLYRTFDLVNAALYASNYTAIVRAFQAAGTRVVLGSPGCVGKVPHWKRPDLFTTDELNVSLCAFRDIDIGIAEQTGVRFADVFWPMLRAGYEGQTRFGTTNESYMISGKDGVHPGWSGHLLMAWSFLRAMGLDGAIGTITVDLATQTAKATAGHAIESVANGAVTVTSSRYPFCATGATNSDDSIRSGMELVPFNQELNRFELVVKNATAAHYKVTWGEETRTYSAGELAAGVNLAADFAVNPFSDAFRRVDEAVAAKQAYETTQIKNAFHGAEGRADMAAAVERTEAGRVPLAEAINAAFVPVKHVIRIQAAE